MDNIIDIIKQRRAIYPKEYESTLIPKEFIEQILEAANWAPTHKRTEPWRFKVFMGEAKERFADQVAEAMQQSTPADRFDPAKQEKSRRKINKSACVIAIGMQRDPENSLPEWEEIAAVACAVQNMWLVCTHLGIGAYWSSPSFLTNHPHDFLKLADGERCLGLFYMGWKTKECAPRAWRNPTEDKVTWM